jgi:hypothetical protein
MTTETYNGWTNRATWNTSLWLNNDYGLYSAKEDFARRIRNHLEDGDITREEALKDMAAKLRAFCNELWPNGCTPDKDRLSHVDWREIAEAELEI